MVGKQTIYKVVYMVCLWMQFLKEEPNENYFCEIWMIPRKYLGAWWEVIRSLVIPLFKGSQYFEGFSTLIIRVFGLVIPGFSAHLCPNYINSTRYGKIQQLIAQHHDMINP